MAINKKLIHFKSKLKFNEELANGNILETSIVFILDTTEIYTHGLFYDGSTFDPSKIEESIENIINTKIDKSDIYYFDVDADNVEEGVITIEEYEKIKKCNLLIFRVCVDEQILSTMSFANKIDGIIFGTGILVFNTIIDDGNGSFMQNTIQFEPNEDGNVTYSITSAPYSFKTINGESILGEGDLTFTTDTSNLATKTELNSKQDTITDLEVIRQGAAKGATSVQQGTLSTVATSGSYNDLSNKPSIPSAVTESTVSGWGFTKNTGTYSKPSTGIPKTDLASAVQTSLGKADTALLSYTEQYKGTITGVSANGTSVATSGVANIPAASTSAYGVIKLSSATNSTSTSLAATASAVKAAYDLANSYKGTVTGIKINGSTKNSSNGVVDLGTVIIKHQDISHLATKAEIPTVPTKISDLTDDSNFVTVRIVDDMDGLDVPSDIEISKSTENSSSTNAYLLVNHGTSDTTFTLTPNTFHVWDEVTTLDLDFGTETEGIANEYLFLFTSGATTTTLTLPDNIKWTSEPNIGTNKIYLISILNELGTILEFDI